MFLLWSLKYDDHHRLSIYGLGFLEGLRAWSQIVMFLADTAVIFNRLYNEKIFLLFFFSFLLQAHYRLGSCLRTSQRLSEAQQSFSRSLQLLLKDTTPVEHRKEDTFDQLLSVVAESGNINGGCFLLLVSFSLSQENSFDPHIHFLYD